MLRVASTPRIHPDILGATARAARTRTDEDRTGGAWLRGRLGLLALGARVAEAHQVAGDADHPDGRPWSIAVAALAGLALILVAWLVTRQAKARVAILVAGLVSVLALEAGIHSVHHLDSPEQAAKCQVLFTSKHLSGECPTPPPQPEEPAEGTPLASAPIDAYRPDPAFGPGRERGPPAGSA